MNLVKLVLDLIYPPRCPFCGHVLEVWEEEGLCHQCQKTLPWQLEVGKQVDFCERCFSPLWYRGSVRRGMQQFKFRGGQIHARLFGTLMAQCLHDQWGEEVDCITWVPVTRRRLGERGFDQCELLAREVGKNLGVEVVSALEKVRDTKQQARITSSSARQANVTGAYAAREGIDLTGKQVVLVDDVVTSGATMAECAACLRIAGAENVIGLTLVRAR